MSDEDEKKSTNQAPDGYRELRIPVEKAFNDSNKGDEKEEE